MKWQRGRLRSEDRLVWCRIQPPGLRDVVEDNGEEKGFLVTHEVYWPERLPDGFVGWAWPADDIELLAEFSDAENPDSEVRQ